MRFEPIVTSLLDTDLYKFNMNQVIFHKHTDLVGEYHFKCRWNSCASGTRCGTISPSA